MGALYGDTLGLIQPFANISSTCFCTTSNLFAERWYYLCLEASHVCPPNRLRDPAVDEGQVQVPEKHPETHRKGQRNASQSFPPPQILSTHRMVKQELPSRLHRAQFSKLQASFKQKPLWHELTKEPCSQEQRHNHPSRLHPAYIHANSEQYQHHQNTIVSQPSRYVGCTCLASPCQVSHQM